MGRIKSPGEISITAQREAPESGAGREKMGRGYKRKMQERQIWKSTGDRKE
ncbi:MAG: hypothetical protein JW814_04990 [Candidatus Krumholzibacteriota bacterium]|nr:hypothetical protein [Candidatus Krumholzibacteriota bacterium]